MINYLRVRIEPGATDDTRTVGYPPAKPVQMAEVPADNVIGRPGTVGLVRLRWAAQSSDRLWGELPVEDQRIVWDIIAGDLS